MVKEKKTPSYTMINGRQCGSTSRNVNRWSKPQILKFCKQAGISVTGKESITSMCSMIERYNTSRGLPVIGDVSPVHPRKSITVIDDESLTKSEKEMYQSFVGCNNGRVECLLCMKHVNLVYWNKHTKSKSHQELLAFHKEHPNYAPLEVQDAMYEFRELHSS